MRIGREIWVTAVTAVGVLFGLSVLWGWNWPVVGDSVAWGIVAVGLVSLVACGSSGWATQDVESWYRDPWIIAAMVVGTATLAAGVIGLITGGATWLAVMIAGTVLLWALSTLHHVAAATTGGGRRATAA